MLVAPDGKRAVSGSYDRTLKLWDLERGETIRTLEGHTGWVLAVAITPDGQRAISGSNDHTLRLWDLSNGEEIASFAGEGPISCCAVLPDGTTFLAGDATGTLHFLRLVEAPPSSTTRPPGASPRLSSR